MKYIDEYRDPAAAKAISARIHAEVDPAREYKLMEFCGGHTHAIARYGVTELLPPNVKMIHGPGCPVCVLPIGRIDQAIELALKHNVILCTYGDTMRVPASDGLSLIKAKARGADVRMVYSASDALQLARDNPEREVVFFAIGFETTTPPTAMVAQAALREGISNFSILCCHVLTPPAIAYILDSAPKGEAVTLEGFVGPAHVSIIIGSDAYAPFAKNYQKPVVIAGFEPLDVLQAILMLVRQVNEGRHEVENEFIRAVNPTGNAAAIDAMADVFELRETFEWRGLGEMPKSALRLNKKYRALDAELKFSPNYQSVPDHKQCECAAILRGVKTPIDCKLFGNVCTPESPTGACMVSSEGACAAHYSYGRFRDIAIAKG
ncbi:MAG: hydrogenase formation protein HypD [Burkholderiaceae bacterium]|nr:hydrogenase formation protein HypD [Burkholderiaceae bacterium]